LINDYGLTNSSKRYGAVAWGSSAEPSTAAMTWSGPDLDDARRMPSHTSSIIVTFFIAPIHTRGKQYSCTSTI
jgi:hypothetical protein